MRRSFTLAAAVAAAIAIHALLGRSPADATLDDDVFTSREADVRMLAPRGWRVSDTPAYPGILLWMHRSKPPGEMLLTVEDIGPAWRACWPKECGDEPTVPGFLCVLSGRLRATGFQVGPIEDGRWFDYQDGKSTKRFLRQGVVVIGHRAFTLILSTPTSADRATHARAFDRALRSLRPLSAEASASSGAGADLGATVGDGGSINAGAASRDSDGGAIAPDGTATAPLDGGSQPAAVAGSADGNGGAASGTPDGGVATAGGGDAGAASPDAGAPAFDDVPPCRAP